MAPQLWRWRLRWPANKVSASPPTSMVPVASSRRWWIFSLFFHRWQRRGEGGFWISEIFRSLELLFPVRGRRGGAGERELWDPCTPALMLQRRCPLQRRCGACEFWCVRWRSSGFSSLSSEGDDLNLAVFCSSSPSSCGHAEAEIDDFPSVVMLPQDTRFADRKSVV